MCDNLVKELKDSYNNEVEVQLKSVRAELDNLLRQQVEFMMHITKHRY